MFSIPGSLFGFFIMTLLLFTLKLIIYDATKFAIFTEVDNFTLYVGLFMGIAVPLIANYLPIREAMSKSLRDSLDIYRKSLDDLTVTLTRLEHMGISPMQLLVGLMLTMFGFVVYYFIPSSILA